MKNIKKSLVLLSAVFFVMVLNVGSANAENNVTILATTTRFFMFNDYVNLTLKNNSNEAYVWYANWTIDTKVNTSIDATSASGYDIKGTNGGIITKTKFVFVTSSTTGNNTDRACITIWTYNDTAFSAYSIRFNRNITVCLNKYIQNGTFWDSTVSLWLNTSQVQGANYTYNEKPMIPSLGNTKNDEFTIYGQRGVFLKTNASAITTYLPFPSSLTYPVLGYQDSMTDTGKCYITALKPLSQAMLVTLYPYSNEHQTIFTLDNSVLGFGNKNEYTATSTGLSTTPYTFTYYTGFYNDTCINAFKWFYDNDYGNIFDFYSNKIRFSMTNFGNNMVLVASNNYNTFGDLLTLYNSISSTSNNLFITEWNLGGGFTAGGFQTFNSTKGTLTDLNSNLTAIKNLGGNVIMSWGGQTENQTWLDANHPEWIAINSSNQKVRREDPNRYKVDYGLPEWQDWAGNITYNITNQYNAEGMELDFVVGDYQIQCFNQSHYHGNNTFIYSNGTRNLISRITTEMNSYSTKPFVLIEGANILTSNFPNTTTWERFGGSWGTSNDTTPYTMKDIDANWTGFLEEITLPILSQAYIANYSVFTGYGLQCTYGTLSICTNIKNSYSNLISLMIPMNSTNVNVTNSTLDSNKLFPQIWSKYFNNKVKIFTLFNSNMTNSQSYTINLTDYRNSETSMYDMNNKNLLTVSSLAQMTDKVLQSNQTNVFVLFNFSSFNLTEGSKAKLYDTSNNLIDDEVPVMVKNVSASKIFINSTQNYSNINFKINTTSLGDLTSRTWYYKAKGEKDVLIPSANVSYNNGLIFDLKGINISESLDSNEIYGTPKWYNNKTSIPTNYTVTPSIFNISWNDSSPYYLNKVFIEMNYSGIPTNYSMTRISGNQYDGVYNYNLTLPSGTFYWKSYANSSDGGWNATDTWYFTVNKASTTSFMNLTRREYPQGTIYQDYDTGADLSYSAPTSQNITGWYSSIFDGQTITFTLYQGQTSIGTSNPQSSTRDFTDQTETWTYNTSGNVNYSSASKDIVFTYIGSKVGGYKETIPIILRCLGNWTCSEWSQCFPNNTQYRSCKYLSNCGILNESHVFKYCIFYIPKTYTLPNFTLSSWLQKMFTPLSIPKNSNIGLRPPPSPGSVSLTGFVVLIGLLFIMPLMITWVAWRHYRER